MVLALQTCLPGDHMVLGALTAVQSIHSVQFYSYLQHHALILL
jgi:hypothetical protein